MTGKQKLRLLLDLFFSYFKIGLFTFGGGYAMISLIEREYVERKKWISEVELYEIITIAESTPGPVAINCATFVGYKIMGVVGSFFATLAVCIPSFVIIYLISIFYDAFMQLTAVAYAFKGINVGVAVMITLAGINMFKKAKKSGLFYAIFCFAFAAASLIDIFNVDFSTIYLILIGGALGLILQICSDVRAKKKGEPYSVAVRDPNESEPPHADGETSEQRFKREQSDAEQSEEGDIRQARRDAEQSCAEQTRPCDDAQPSCREQTEQPCPDAQKICETKSASAKEEQARADEGGQPCGSAEKPSLDARAKEEEKIKIDDTSCENAPKDDGEGAR